MTAALTRHRTRDSLTPDEALEAVRDAGYDVRNDHPKARGTYVGFLSLAGFQSVVLFDADGLPWSVLYSRYRRLLRFRTNCLVNHNRIPLSPTAALATARKFARDMAHAATSETMTVTVRDRGFTTPKALEVTISAFCAICGEHRGDCRDDGSCFWMQLWANPCGHSDYFPRIIAEARALQLAAKAVIR